jgi:hypothetical protein
VFHRRNVVRHGDVVLFAVLLAEVLVRSEAIPEITRALPVAALDRREQF